MKHEANHLRQQLFHRQIHTFSEPSKLLDNSVLPSLENLIPVISSEWPRETCMSGLLPHPGLIFQICMKRNLCKNIVMKKNKLRRNQNCKTRRKLMQKIRNTDITCKEPSPIPPAMHFPSRSQAQVVTGTLPGLESFGLIT